MAPCPASNSITLINKMGLEVKNLRAHNDRTARVRRPSTRDSESSIDSLQEFFLQKFAKGRQGRKSTEGGSATRQSQTPSLKAILNTVWPTLDRKGRLRLVLGVAMCAVVAVSNPIFSYAFAQLLATFWLPDAERAAEGSKWAGVTAAIGAVDASATFLGYMFMDQAAQGWVDRLRAEAFRRVLSQPMAWHDRAGHRPARVVECLDRNAEEMRKLVGTFLPGIITVGVMVATALVWALAIRWDLALVILSGAPVVAAAARLGSRSSSRWQAACDAAADAAAAVFAEAFTQVRTVRALTMERLFAARHRRAAAAALRLGRRRALWAGAFHGLNQSAGVFLTALVFYYGAVTLRDGRASATDATRVINLLLFSVGTAAALLSNMPQIAAAEATAVQLLHYASLRHDAGHESAAGRRGVVVDTPLPVRMRGLRFAYPDRGTGGAGGPQALRNVTLDISPGTSTAIVGPSGSGKSTIAALLLRLYEPLPPERARLELPALPRTPPQATLYSRKESPGRESPRSDHALMGSTERVWFQAHLPSGLSRPPGSQTPAAAAAAAAAAASATAEYPLTFGGHAAAALATPALRNLMGYVPQQPFLFPASVRDNIAYGLHEASPLRRQPALEAAARAAGIHDFVASLPQGYDTVVGFGGGGGGGGGGQQTEPGSATTTTTTTTTPPPPPRCCSCRAGRRSGVCIARALARAPRLLVMDEPTSALDAEAAARVRDVVRRLADAAAKRTSQRRRRAGNDMAVVVVTHSVEMMRVADRLAVVEQGTVVETGRFDDLLARPGGRLAQMVGGGGGEAGRGRWPGPRMLETGEGRRGDGRKMDPQGEEGWL